MRTTLAPDGVIPLGAVILDLFAAIDAHDWHSLESFFHPEIVYERPGYPPIVGVERLLRFYREQRVIAAGEHIIERIVVAGPYGACWGRFLGVKKDGSLADELFADVYSFEGGAIRARRSHFFRPAL
jgi:ketosteroid isomerase-like protein